MPFGITQKCVIKLYWIQMNNPAKQLHQNKLHPVSSLLVPYSVFVSTTIRMLECTL